MENLIEKLKGLDKKVWIGVGIGAAALIILIVVLLIGSGNSRPSGSTQGSSQGNSQTESQTGTQAGTEGTQGTETTEGTETETTEGTETETTETEMTESESESQSESQQPSETPQPSEKPSEKPSETPQPSESESEDHIGVGTKDNPHKVIPNLDNMTLTTDSVPAGKTLYYSVQRVGGMWLTIEDADAYVITSGGKKIEAKNGVVSFQLENAMASEDVLFQVGNKSGSAKAFTIKFSNLKGTQMNPEVISGNGPFTKHLNAGDEVGYYYSVKAAQGGTMRIYMTATANSEMNVQNNSGVGTVARSFTADTKTDEQGREYIELPVNAGDEIRIHVQAVKPTRGSVPATDITFEIAYN